MEKAKRSKNPLQYWKDKGLRLPKGEEGISIYSTANLGTETYLVELGDHVRINDGVQLVTHDGGAWVLRSYLKEENAKNIDIFGCIKIGSNVHIGTNAVIMPGVTIGDNCIIGCGAIVTRDIPDGSVAVGVPARVIESIDEYAEKTRKRFMYTKQLTQQEKREKLKEYFSFK